MVLLLLLVFGGACEDRPKVQELPAVEQKPFTTDAPNMRVVISKKDGAKMVWIPGEFEVIPETREIIPATYDKSGDVVRGEHEIVTPEKIVKVVDAFYMDVYEVTVGQFKKFLKSSGYEPDEPINWTFVYKHSPTEKHPMIYVDWHDATAYAKWAGKRLPYEKEWAWSARGGLKNKKYSWGDDKSLARDYANYTGTDGKDEWKYSAPVGSLKPNGYGLYDMGGNVWEWCQDWYSSERRDRVLRSGSWNSAASTLRVAHRYYGHSPSDRNTYLGFRCVADLP